VIKHFWGKWKKILIDLCGSNQIPAFVDSFGKCVKIQKVAQSEIKIKPFHGLF